MRVLVLGAAGMLGHKVAQVLRQREHAVTVTTRQPPSAYAHLGVFDGVQHVGHVSAEDPDSLRAVVSSSSPEAVVNCIGVVKQLQSAKQAVPSIRVNALLPHQLEVLCQDADSRLIHVSTDCVFSGERGDYTEDDRPDAGDLYGRSKALGEVVGPSSLTLRTSIIGRELAATTGLVEWFLAQPGPEVPGYTGAYFSGLPTLHLADIIARILEDHPHLSGLHHVGGPRIAKYDLLQLVAAAYGREVRLVPDDQLVIDRSLDSSKLWSRLQDSPLSWKQMVQEMVLDPSPYGHWRARDSAR